MTVHKAAITLFKVIEHIPDPVMLLAELHQGFPKTVILASVHNPKRTGLFLKDEREPSDYTPNHFPQSTPKALGISFWGADYQELIVVLPQRISSEILFGISQFLYKVRTQGTIIFFLFSVLR